MKRRRLRARPSEDVAKDAGDALNGVHMEEMWSVEVRDDEDRAEDLEDQHEIRRTLDAKIREREEIKDPRDEGPANDQRVRGEGKDIGLEIFGVAIDERAD